jgi:hypothetical protein
MVSYIWLAKVGSPQIRKFANLNNLLDLRTFRKCSLCRFAIYEPNLFSDLRLKTYVSAQMHTFSPYKYSI